MLVVGKFGQSLREHGDGVSSGDKITPVRLLFANITSGFQSRIAFTDARVPFFRYAFNAWVGIYDLTSILLGIRGEAGVQRHVTTNRFALTLARYLSHIRAVNVILNESNLLSTRDLFFLCVFE